MTPTPTPEGSRGPSPLVGATELAALLGGERPPALLDIRWRLGEPAWGRRQHAVRHLAGARFVDLDTELSGPPGPGGRHPLPDARTVGTALRRAGVDNDRPVVVYDQADSMGAARAWWVIRYFGHPDVRVLDGGLRAWEESGLPLEEGPVPPAEGTFEPHPGAMPEIDAAAAAHLAEHGLLLDARAAERYRGEVEPVDPVAGHIPGAVSAPTAENVDETGRFLPAATLRRRFEGLGATSGAEVAAYCGSGVTAAHEVLALSLAGIDAGLYVGSWSEWITDPARPVVGPR